MQYPWTEQGLQLLSTIQAYVEEQGGREALYEAVLQEQDSGNHTCPESFRKQADTIVSLYGTMPRRDISDYMGLKFSQVKTVIDGKHREGTLTKLGRVTKKTVKRKNKPVQAKIRKNRYEYQSS